MTRATDDFADVAGSTSAALRWRLLGDDRQAAGPADEEAAQRDPLGFPPVDGGLVSAEPLLDRPERPALVGRELLERGAFDVQRADVADLGGALVILLEPTQR